MSIQRTSLAEAQFFGYAFGSRGYNIECLAESMGLTLSEWLTLRESCHLKDDDKQALDQYFSNNKPAPPKSIKSKR